MDLVSLVKWVDGLTMLPRFTADYPLTLETYQEAVDYGVVEYWWREAAVRLATYGTPLPDVE
jgi:hypothetical protein